MTRNLNVRRPLGISTGDRYRIVSEERIIEMLLLCGWVYEQASPEAKAACRETLRCWIELGLGYRRESNGERFFDPVEVVNFMKRTGLDERNGFWAERSVTSSRRMVSELSDGGSSGISRRGERHFAVNFTRTFNLRSIPPGSRLRLRAPLPLEGDYLWNLQVKPIANTDTQIEVKPGRLEARIAIAGQPEITLGAELSFSARSHEPCIGQNGAEPDRALYLRHQEGLIVVTERVSSLALALAGADSPSLEAVHAFWNYINGEMICGMLHYDELDAAAPCDSILDSGWFDCQMASALLVSLCRARGIPARLVGGNFLYRLVPLKHFWTEVWLEDRGWTPFDFLTWELSRGGRDAEWKDHFFGRIDQRMITERLPREFTGVIGVPIPHDWCILQLPRNNGGEINLLDGTGATLYADTLHVTG